MPLQLLAVFEIVSRLENLQLKVHYVFCLYIYICWFLVLVFVFTLCIMFMHFQLFKCFCNLGLLVFSNLHLSIAAFNKIDITRWVFNLLFWIGSKSFVLSCFSCLLFYENDLQFARFKVPFTYNLPIAILSKLPCIYTWVVICELVSFCIALVRC
jgi:hypothetical protein